MADDKLYTPEVIQDTPFPGDPSTSQDSQSQSTPSGTYKPATTSQKPFKKPVIAQETIGQALNTRSKKILQEFDLVQSGGIKVGNYQEGNSGDLRITPNGITARDQSGSTTFAIDGTTGDAVFKGRITGGSMNINNQFTVDEDGNIVARSIALAGTNTSVNASLGQTISSLSATDITGASLSLTVERPTIVLLLADVRYYLLQTSGSGDWSAVALIQFDVDGTPYSEIRFEGGMNMPAYSGVFGPVSMTSGSMHRIVTLDAGQHTIKLQGYLISTDNNGALVVYNYRLSTATLGGVMP